MMKRIVCVACALLALCFLLSSCGSREPLHTVSEELGIRASGGETVSHSDSHGGFHGDGLTCTVLRFSGGEVLEQIQKDPRWEEFPLSEEVRALAYGIEDEDGRVGPFLTDSEGNAIIPEVKKGYYRLIDRLAEPGKATGADFLHRNSFNFTLGIYDADAGILYFCKLDT